MSDLFPASRVVAAEGDDPAGSDAAIERTARALLATGRIPSAQAAARDFLWAVRAMHQPARRMSPRQKDWLRDLARTYLPKEPG